MNREFSVSVGWKIFYTILGTSGFGYAIYLFCANVNNGLGEFIFLILISAAALSLIATKWKSKIIVDDETIIFKSLFEYSEIFLVDIIGYKFSGNRKFLHVKSVSSEIIIFLYFEYSGSDDFMKWLGENYPQIR